MISFKYFLVILLRRFERDPYIVNNIESNMRCARFKFTFHFCFAFFSSTTQKMAPQLCLQVAESRLQTMTMASLSNGRATQQMEQLNAISSSSIPFTHTHAHAHRTIRKEKKPE